MMPSVCGSASDTAWCYHGDPRRLGPPDNCSPFVSYRKKVSLEEEGEDDVQYHSINLLMNQTQN